MTMNTLQKFYDLFRPLEFKIFYGYDSVNKEWDIFLENILNTDLWKASKYNWFCDRTGYGSMKTTDKERNFLPLIRLLLQLGFKIYFTEFEVWDFNASNIQKVPTNEEIHGACTKIDEYLSQDDIPH